MNKKIILASLAVLFFAALASAGNLEVSSTNYDPTPAAPGNTITLWVHLYNNSNGDAKDAFSNINLKANTSSIEFPFSLVAGQSPTQELGTITSKQTALVSYKILIDPKAPDGTYTITIEMGENGVVVKSTPITIQILKRKPTLMVVSSEPQSAEIGKTMNLNLVLKNTGSSNASNISIGLAEDRTVTTTGVVVERDIVPLGAAFSNIQSLNIDQTASAEIPLMINPSATAKAYYIPLTLTFYDENKTKYSQTEYVGVKVSDKADIGIDVSTITPALAAGQSSAINLDLYNTGLGSANYLVLEAKADFGTLTQDSFFIGTLNADDSDSVLLNVSVPGTENAGAHNLEITMKFKNEFGEEQTIVKNIPVTLYSAAELAGQGSGGQTPWLLYIILILVIAGGAYWVFGKKKKK